MNKLRRIYPWISLSISISLGLWVYGFVSSLSQVEAVVVAARALPPLSVVGPGDVKVAYVHPHAIAPGAARDREKVVGMTCLRQVFPGEQMMLAALSGSSGGLSVIVSADHKALAVPVTPGR
ncbi:MAG: SAF domain-containing protein, partial [Bacillota bacterium]